MDYLFFLKKNPCRKYVGTNHLHTNAFDKNENLDFFEMETSEENNFECEISQRCIKITKV